MERKVKGCRVTTKRVLAREQPLTVLIRRPCATSLVKPRADERRAEMSSIYGQLRAKAAIIGPLPESEIMFVRQLQADSSGQSLERSRQAVGLQVVRTSVDVGVETFEQFMNRVLDGRLAHVLSALNGGSYELSEAQSQKWTLYHLITGIGGPAALLVAATDFLSRSDPELQVPNIPEVALAAMGDGTHHWIHDGCCPVGDVYALAQIVLGGRNVSFDWLEPGVPGPCVLAAFRFPDRLQKLLRSADFVILTKAMVEAFGDVEPIHHSMILRAVIKREDFPNADNDNVGVVQTGYKRQFFFASLAALRAAGTVCYKFAEGARWSRRLKGVRSLAAGQLSLARDDLLTEVQRVAPAVGGKDPELPLMPEKGGRGVCLELTGIPWGSVEVPNMRV